MRGYRFVLMRKEIPINGSTLSNGEDEQMLKMMEAKGWFRMADKTKPSLFAMIKELLN